MKPEPAVIHCHVIGVWDNGDMRTVEIKPGTEGGVAEGMTATFESVAAHPRHGGVLKARIFLSDHKTALLETSLLVEEIGYDVTVA